MGRIVIACYRPKPGCAEALRELMRTHVARLRAEGLVTDRAPIIAEAADGTIVEVFEWRSADAIAIAHQRAPVLAMWDEYAAVCDYVPIATVAEASQLFTELTPLDGTRAREDVLGVGGSGRELRVRMPILHIPARLRGPPTSGNGGCACGLIARALGRPVEVTLRAPPPLEAPLALEGLTLTFEGRTIAAVAPLTEPLEAPDPIRFADAVRASARFRHAHDHPLPSCFVCGTGRDDGLKIWPGSVESGDGVAAPWTPDATVTDADGAVREEIVWGALDCPQYFGLGPDTPFMLLGRMAAIVHRRPHVGEPCVVRGWRIGGDGRKGVAGASLHTGDELLAVARGTWIAVDPARFT